MKELRSIPNEERNDSTFVTKCIDYLYGGKHYLIDRVATFVKVPNGKKPISPEKIEIVSNMLQERLDSESLPDELSSHRFGRLNQLLNNAISTARKSNKSVSSTTAAHSTITGNKSNVQPPRTMPMFNSTHKTNTSSDAKFEPPRSMPMYSNTPYHQANYAPNYVQQTPYQYVQYAPQQMSYQPSPMLYQHPQYSPYPYKSYAQYSTAVENDQITNL